MTVVDPRDAALQAACPVLPVPRFGELPPATPGQRVLLARDGVYLEVTRSWFGCVHKLASLPINPPLPYGVVREVIHFAFGVIPITLLERFVAYGRQCLPNEAAGALVYSRERGSLRLVLHEALQAGPDGIDYRVADLGAGEELAIDLHTHGTLSAFWSATDNADDQGVKVCGVFGNLDRSRPSAAFRLAVNGHFIALPHPWERAEPVAEVDVAGSCPTLSSMGFETCSLWNT
jgi:PRTRC genetic system protein A